MKYLIIKDKKKRINATKIQLKKLCLKSLFLEHYTVKDMYITSRRKKKKKKPNFLFYFKFLNCLKLSNLGKNGALCLIKNRCKISGRAKSVIRFYRISRIVFRELASCGHLLGVRKSSW